MNPPPTPEADPATPAPPAAPPEVSPAAPPEDSAEGLLHASAGAGRVVIICVALAVLLVLLALVRLAVGSSSLGLPAGELAEPIWRARGFRLGLGCTVGAALATSGVGLQALLRNPLAEPYILGLSTGAAAGMMAQALVLRQFDLTPGVQYLGAAAGAGASMLIVYAASRKHGTLDPLGLLLTGVVLSTINAAIIMLLNYLVGPGGVRDDIARWMMGYLNESVGAGTLGAVAAVTAAGVGLLWWRAPAMDIATLSDAEAVSLGVHLTRLRTLLFVTASVLAAGAVVLAGPIAFVGLISPHVARLLLGARHRGVLVGAVILGAALVLLADLLSVLLAVTLGIGLMPIGVFTAMAGGPLFLVMLRPRLGRGDL